MSEANAFHFNTQLRGLKTIAACADLFRSAVAPFGFDTFACGELDLKVRDSISLIGRRSGAAST
jgi:hypothetical protein